MRSVGHMRVGLVGLASVALSASCLGTQEAIPVADDGPVVFQLAAEVLPNSRVQLNNGAVVAAADWPALIFPSPASRTPVANSTERPTCTGAFIGPNVMLTAAHCVDKITGPPRKLAIRFGVRTIKFRCSVADEYLARQPAFQTPRGSEDFALCLLLDQRRPPEALSDVRFEVVERTPIPANTAVLMTGYGCDGLQWINGAFVSPPADGLLRIGDEHIATAAAADASRNGQYVTTRSIDGREPTLCPGDSGGPLFSDATIENPEGVTVIDRHGRRSLRPRRLRGVNSSLQQAPDSSGDILSNVSDLGTGAFDRFLTSWLAETQTWLEHPENAAEASSPRICGVNIDAGRSPCRD